MKENIDEAMVDVSEEHAIYKVLHDEYVNSMQSSGIALNDGTVSVKTTTGKQGFIADGTFYGNEKAALTAGVITLQKVDKPEKLVNSEKRLSLKIKQVHTLIDEFLLPYQVKMSKTRSSNGTPGEVGAGKIAQVLSDIERIDPDAVVNFAGRRVMGTLKNGTIPFSYNVYGVSFLDTLEAKYNS